MHRAPRGLRPRGRIIARLDRVAHATNPLLLVVAIMLAILNVGCYVALELGRLHPLRPVAPQPARSAAVLSRAAVSRLPPD